MDESSHGGRHAEPSEPVLGGADKVPYPQPDMQREQSQQSCRPIATGRQYLSPSTTHCTFQFRFPGIMAATPRTPSRPRRSQRRIPCGRAAAYRGPDTTRPLTAFSVSSSSLRSGCGLGALPTPHRALTLSRGTQACKRTVLSGRGNVAPLRASIYSLPRCDVMNLSADDYSRPCEKLAASPVTPGL